MGARVEIQGDVWDEANEHAMAVGQQSGFLYIHPFDDDSAHQEQIQLLQQEKILVELASSCVLAAYLKHVVPFHQGKNVVIVLCGGNASIEQLRIPLKQD